jgi:hypothetical protein
VRFRRTSRRFSSGCGSPKANWLKVVGNFGRLFYRVAGGPTSVSRQRTHLGRRFRPGGARLLGASPSPS